MHLNISQYGRKQDVSGDFKSFSSISCLGRAIGIKQDPIPDITAFLIMPPKAQICTNLHRFEVENSRR